MGSTTRFVRALSLPTAALATVATLVALAEVEALEAAQPEPSLGTVLPRLPPAVKFPARNVAMSPDRSAGMCQELFQDRSVPTYQGSSVATFLGSSAAMSRDRWKDKNVLPFLANRARQCRDNSALTC